MTRYLLVGNPTAQSGKAQARIDRTLEAILARGIEANFLATKPGGATVEAVATAVSSIEYDVCIYLGGDGTFHEVGRGLLAGKTGTPMGMMPSGTANDQGRSFGIDSSVGALERNLDIIAAGHITHLDAGHVDRLDDSGKIVASTTFFDSAGWGMQPDILEARNRDREAIGEIPLLREIYRDKAVYVGAALDQLLQSYVEPVKFTAEVVIDGTPHEFTGLTDLIINATAIYAGSWVLDRDGLPDDGEMELVPMHGRREWVSKAIRDHAEVPVWQEDLDLFGVSHSDSHPGSEFHLTLSRPEGDERIRSQVDGEEWSAGNVFHVRVERGALPLITRADWQPPWLE